MNIMTTHPDHLSELWVKTSKSISGYIRLMVVSQHANMHAHLLANVTTTVSYYMHSISKICKMLSQSHLGSFIAM